MPSSPCFSMVCLLVSGIAFAQIPDEALPPVTDSEPAPPNSPAAEAEAVPSDGPAPTAETEPSSLESPPATASEPPTSTSTPADAPVVTPVPRLETVIVGTSVVNTSGALHLIKSSQLERFERDDPHAVLTQVPGVYVRGEDGFGLRPNIGLRGANADRSKKITLLEDGVLLGPAPYSAPAAYYFPLITRMQTVRVLKGPSAIIHGPQTVGGSVEMLTRSVPTSRTFGLDVAGGEHLYGKLHAYGGVSNDGTGFLIEGVHLRNQGFKVLDSGGSTGFVRNEWMAKAQHVLEGRGSTKHTFGLKLGYSGEQSNETYLGLSDADFRAQPLRRYMASQFDHMGWYRTQVALSHEVEASGFLLTTTAYRHDFDRTWRKVNRFLGAAISDVLADPTGAENSLYYGVLTGELDTSSTQEQIYIGPNHRVFVSQGIQSVARFSATTGPVHQDVEMGVRYHFDSIDRHHSEDAYDVRGGQLQLVRQPTLVTARNKDSTHAVALHAINAVRWRRLTLTPGARLEIIKSRSVDALAGTTSDAGVVVPLLGVGAHVSLWNGLGVFAGANRGFSPPPPGDRNAVPEDSINYEAGIRWTPGNARFEVIGFYNDYANLTDICTFSNGCLAQDLDRQFSAGRANIYGAEAYAEKRFRAGGFSFPFTLAYTLTRTRLLTSFDSADPQLGKVQAGDELPYVPKHQLQATAGVEWHRFGMSVSGLYVGPMREVAGQGAFVPGETTDALWTVDGAASFEVVNGLKIYLNAQNLFNRTFIVARRPFGARPNAPREVRVGLKLNL